jgi:cytochrome P450
MNTIPKHDTSTKAATHAPGQAGEESLAAQGFDRFGFLDPGVRADPYPVYRLLREEDPVHWLDPLQGWLITRYADCEAALTDPSLSYGGGLAEMFKGLPADLQEEFLPLRRHIEMGVGSLNPPEHTRIRAPMNRAFTLRLIREQSRYVQQITNEMLDAVLARGQMDVVADLAFPLPALVIANMFGTSRDKQHLFLQCSDALGDLFGSATPSIAVLRRAHEHVSALSEHLDDLLQRRSRDGADGEDLMAVLLRAEAGGSLTRDELVANCIELLFAGHLTISTLISTALLTLLRNPQAVAVLQREPALMPGVVEEVLRYDSPVQMLRRLATRDIELAGRTIERGQMVWVVLGAAHRDPRRYDDPDRFDFRRTGLRHLAFSVGIHYCLGAALARLESDIVLNTILRRLPNIRLGVGTLEWWELPMIRSLKTLPIAFDA